MSSTISQKINLLSTAILLTSTILAVENTNPAYAQSPQDYIYSSCADAYQNYQHYHNQPVASPMDSEFTTSSHNMQMATIALNRVTDCAMRYSQLVNQDSSYCPQALNYMEQISPIMSTAAITINHNCLR
jgi:hypothetical protein